MQVLTLYAGYLAFNTLGVNGLRRIVMEIHEGTAGRGEWRGDNMMLEPIRHAHVLHGRGVFSKHDLADGKYEDVDVQDLDPRLLPEYCLMVVMQSIRMPSILLHQLLHTPALLDTSRPDLYALDTKQTAAAHRFEQAGGGGAGDGAGAVQPLPASYNHAMPNSTACWDGYWGRWLPATPPYSADSANEGACLVEGGFLMPPSQS
jgi:hypothetical protein